MHQNKVHEVDDAAQRVADELVDRFPLTWAVAVNDTADQTEVVALAGDDYPALEGLLLPFHDTLSALQHAGVLPAMVPDLRSRLAEQAALENAPVVLREFTVGSYVCVLVKDEEHVVATVAGLHPQPHPPGVDLDEALRAAREAAAVVAAALAEDGHPLHVE